MTDYNKLSAYVGFAVRAGQVLWGSDLIMEKKRKRKLILLSSTASENLRDKIAAYADEADNPGRRLHARRYFETQHEGSGHNQQGSGRRHNTFC